ncbi:MAG: hypothetical protein IKK20_02065 [Clostridia bacterium]|nr:hypothetical protein [Clostridia bacterium]MBR2433598.1 hypothetical protein [Clostridia bacterium]MBR3790569.1 hypothetical protein [Clostridia bacterium]
MNIEKILEFQSLDNEIRKLEQQLANSPDQKAIEGLQKLVKETQTTSANLEKEAENSVNEYQKMQKSSQDAIATMNNLAAKKEQSLSEEEYAACVKQLNNIAGFLANIEKRIMQIADKVNAILSEYENAKQNYNHAKQKHSMHKNNLLALQQQILPQIEQLSSKLATLESGLDQTFLKKYKAKRADRIFPVVVPMRDNSCGGCMMELPMAQIEKLKKDGFLECESCHRIIYLK